MSMRMSTLYIAFVFAHPFQTPISKVFKLENSTFPEEFQIFY